MSKSEVEVLYECFVCGRAFSKVQALRGHMNAHKGHNYRRTSIWADKDRWKAFEDLCREHKTTTCHMLDVLIKASLKAEELGVIQLPTANPLVINVSHVFLGKPRSSWKTDLTSAISQGPSCPRCGSREVSTMDPEGLEYGEGRCLRCGAEWQATRGRGPRSGRPSGVSRL